MAIVKLEDHLNARNRVERIGIELEGGWDKGKIDPKSLTADSSVKFQPDYETLRADIRRALERGDYLSKEQTTEYQKWKLTVPAHTGEMVSPPMEPFSDLFTKWMQSYYPQHVNHTCGMHTHLSFRSPLTYQRLMTPDYMDTILQYLAEWGKKNALPANHPLWNRLAGNDSACRTIYCANEQAAAVRKEYQRDAPGCRYTAVNYSFLRHGTIELRILPMMPTISLAIDCINSAITWTNAFLRATAHRREKTHSAWIIADPIKKETLLECV